MNLGQSIISGSNHCGSFPTQRVDAFVTYLRQDLLKNKLGGLILDALVPEESDGEGYVITPARLDVDKLAGMVQELTSAQLPN